MRIYAARPSRLVRQVAADVLVVIWGVAWWWVGDLVQNAVYAVAGPARETAGSASRLATQFGEAAEQAAKVPGVGDQLRQPFDAAAGSLTEIITAANRQVITIERLGDLLQWLVFALPLAVLVAIWLPLRLRFLLRARAAQRFLDSSADLDLFALRAMTSQPMHVLAEISPDPVGAWRSGDATVIHKLAEVELRRSGLRMPPLAPSVPPSTGGALS
ncbi:MAG: hypothetical protein ABWY56_09460 [Propionibacteriaceae bacterium]